MVKGRKCSCFCQAAKNSVTASSGQYKLIFAEGTTLTVNSGGI